MAVVFAAAAAGGAEGARGEAEAKLVQGETAFWRGDYVASELAFFEALIARPGDVRAHFYLGRIYKSRGLWAKAAGYFEAAAGPAFPEADFFLGLVYYEQGQWEEAAGRYLRYLEVYPGDAAAWFNLGVAYAAAGRVDEAEETYLKVLTEDPRSAAALHNLAVLAHRRGDFGRATFYWRRRLEIEPDGAEGYYGLGLSLLHAGDFIGAARAFNEGASLAPLEGKYFYQAGRVYVELKNYDLAVGFYRRAYELGHDEGEVAESMGLAYERWRRYDEATPLLKKAAELKGAGAGPAFAALGRIQREQGRPGEALANFYEAAERLPGDGEIQNQIGELYLEADLASWAAEAFAEAVAADPANLDFNFNLAVARERSEPGRAAGQWGRYIELADGVPGEKRRLAEARERLELLRGGQPKGVAP